MKKILIFILVFAFLLSGCGKEPEEIVPEVPEISEVSESESSKPLPEEEPKEEPVEEVPEEEPETGDEENDEADYVRAVLEDLGIDKDTKELVISGNSGTDRIELIDSFVASVEKNEAAEVCGMMYGYTMPYYFELSFEPGGMIKHTQISKALGNRIQEFSDIYEYEKFFCFTNEDGEKFSLLREDIYEREELKFSPEQDVPRMPVTLSEAKEKAKRTMLSGTGYAELTKDKETVLYGSYGSVLTEDYSEYADEYYINLEPKCEGIFDVAGKPHYLIYFYEGENFVGEGYYVCADESEVVFGVSMVDGNLVPIAYPAKPRVSLKTE
ncbi:MAG: membrane lipoprotein lipid attachment site-containing protein [Oscillospiraceae bacterium]|nr:membrane lipoprotein lipid attachment site-containing protein [Oscillospiraceae bacterium]